MKAQAADPTQPGEAISIRDKLQDLLDQLDEISGCEIAAINVSTAIDCLNETIDEDDSSLKS